MLASPSGPIAYRYAAIAGPPKYRGYRRGGLRGPVYEQAGAAEGLKHTYKRGDGIRAQIIPSLPILRAACRHLLLAVKPPLQQAASTWTPSF